MHSLERYSSGTDAEIKENNTPSLQRKTQNTILQVLKLEFASPSHPEYIDEMED